MTSRTTKASREITGTIYGSYDYTFEGKGAWVGHAILGINGQPTIKATFVDRNTSLNRSDDGEISGTETISLSLSDAGSFEISAKFIGLPGATPGLYTLQETGDIGNGTGAYGHASGTVRIEGPFLLPDPTGTPGIPPWIAEIHGVIDGIQ